ncbi:MAG: hypothetical protein QME96_05840 [Myxococcota bacterium]|nr:hypothetical protein [Myxococcota bacterium]
MTLGEKIAVAEAVIIGVGALVIVVWRYLAAAQRDLSPMDDDELTRRMTDWGM